MAMCKGLRIDKWFTLRIRLAEPYRKTHRRSRSSRSSTLRVCTLPMMTNVLVQSRKVLIDGRIL